MSREGEAPRPYTYSYKLSSAKREVPGQGQEISLEFRSTLLELTGGCGVCQYFDGTCRKHGISVTKESPRCSSFVRRSLFPSEEEARKQIQGYVNEMLGIREEKTVRRLVGMR